MVVRIAIKEAEDEGLTVFTYEIHVPGWEPVGEAEMVVGPAEFFDASAPSEFFDKFRIEDDDIIAEVPDFFPYGRGINPQDAPRVGAASMLLMAMQAGAEELEARLLYLWTTRDNTFMHSFCDSNTFTAVDTNSSYLHWGKKPRFNNSVPATYVGVRPGEVIVPSKRRSRF